MKTISLQDNLTKLNISKPKPTISLVLTGKGNEKRVSKETQKKILIQKIVREQCNFIKLPNRFG